MSDTYFDSSNSPTLSGGISPLVAQAAQRDPRRLLIQSLMQQGQNTQNTPTYSGKAALAKALTIGLGGIANAGLSADYANQNRDVQDTLQKAVQAGQGWTNPDTGQVAAGTGGPNAMAQALMGNPLTAPQGISMIQQNQMLQAKARVDQANKLAEQHMMLDANGNTVPMPGASQAVQTMAGAQSGGAAMGTNAANAQPGVGGQAAVISANAPANAAAKALEINATAAPEANAAALKVNTTAGPEAAAAAQKAGATMPIDVFKEQFKPIVDRATGEVVIPGLDPGTTAKIMSAIGVSPQAAKSALQPQGSAPGAVAAPAGSPLPQPGQAPPGAAPAPSAEAPAKPVPFGTKSPSEEVPKVGLPTGLLPAGPGTLIPGRDPISIKAGEGQVEQANTLYHETQEVAKAANATHAQLSTMRTQVENGGVTPSATAPARFVLSSYLNATLGPDVAKSVTGIDPAQAEVLNKEATRMGLTFARQTEGAREAVAAIKIALGGNPSLGNTKEGFTKLVDIMDAGAKHDLAAQQYGDAWGQKNGHYVGFEGWMNQNHPPAEFTSKVIPYNLPSLQNGQVDPSKLQPNVTYNITSPGHQGPAIWTGEGFKPVQQ